MAQLRLDGIARSLTPKAVCLKTKSKWLLRHKSCSCDMSAGFCIWYDSWLQIVITDHMGVSERRLRGNFEASGVPSCKGAFMRSDEHWQKLLHSSCPVMHVEDSLSNTQRKPSLEYPEAHFPQSTPE